MLEARIPRSYPPTSLRDSTRVAASNPAVWRDILIENRAQLLPRIDRLQAELSGLAGQPAERRRGRAAGAAGTRAQHPPPGRQMNPGPARLALVALAAACAPLPPPSPAAPAAPRPAPGDALLALVPAPARRCWRWTWPACAPPPGPSRCWPGWPNAKRPARAARARGASTRWRTSTPGCSPGWAVPPPAWARWNWRAADSSASACWRRSLPGGRNPARRRSPACRARPTPRQALALLDARTLAFGPPALVRAAAARGDAGGTAHHPWLASVRGALDDEAGQGGRLAVVELAFVVQPDAGNELAEVLGNAVGAPPGTVGGRLLLDRQARGVLVGVTSQAPGRAVAGRAPPARTSGRCQSASRSGRWRWRPCCAGRPPPLEAPAWCWNWRSPRTNAPSSRTSWPPSRPCWPAPRSRSDAQPAP